MSRSRTFLILSAALLAVLSYADFASAIGYTPLVKIPGVPPGPINLSSYLVGLYNFLLSVVGIVAVLMLVIGGMRYISAVGNPAAISSAKDIIYNAFFGLLLALLSWVIVSTMNPDVLYIKKPGSDFSNRIVGVCYKSFDSATSACVCKDDSSPPPSYPIANAGECDSACYLARKCGTKTAASCVMTGTPNIVNSDEFLINTKGWCTCVDGEKVNPVTVGVATCQDACLPNNCFVADFRIGVIAASDNKATSFGFVLPESDIKRAKYYAVNSTTKENPLTFTEGCTLAINAADYTSGPVPVKSYIVDFYFITGPDGTYDPVLEDIPNGYFGNMSCNMPPYKILSANSMCAKEFWSSSVVCPINLQVTYNDGTVKYATQYIKVESP